MSGTVQEISTAIRSIVASAGQVPGSRLSAALKERAPSWRPADFGARSLREFVAANVVGVVVVGRAGMDVIYGLDGAEVPASSDTGHPPSVQPDFWRIWVSPNSPYVLVVDRASAVLRAVPRGTTTTQEEVLLEPPAVAVHRSIAMEFLGRVPDEMRARLQGLLERAPDGWWQAWMRELRGSPLLSAWSGFRREALESRLRSLLLAGTMSEASSALILEAVRRRHLEAPPRPGWARPLASPESAPEGEGLRRVVLDAVSKMSSAELRDLRLPLGLVLDALAPLKSR